MQGPDKLEILMEQRKLITLDGGMGTFLFREYGVQRDPKVWGLYAIAEEEHHEKVVDAHQRYIEAGADVITTFNYSVAPMFVTEIENGI